jgi:hypothetical protein
VTTGSVQLSDIGTVFEITLKDAAGAVVDISGAVTKQLIFRKPDGTKLTKDASYKTGGGIDGVLTYMATTNDIDAAGDWRIQAKVVLVSGTWYSSVGFFTVEANL